MVDAGLLNDKIIITGATGFVGSHIAEAALIKGIDVIAAVRDEASALAFFRTIPVLAKGLETGQLTTVPFNLDGNIGKVINLIQTKKTHCLVHCAWRGLPNYKACFHAFENLSQDLTFLGQATNAGLSHLVVLGTCLEFGNVNGQLAEDGTTAPHTPYGLAKDTLRKALEFKAQELGFTFQWLRLFYTYGRGQNPNSLLAQLDQALNRNEAVFDMSFGEQLRDYLPVEAIAQAAVQLSQTNQVVGVINAASGKPISVRQLVEDWCKKRGKTIVLNRGKFSYPMWEGMAFWGERKKMEMLNR